MGNLGPDKKPSSNTTMGSLDLGGASAPWEQVTCDVTEQNVRAPKTQIVFVPQKSIIQHQFPLKLGRMLLA